MFRIFFFFAFCSFLASQTIQSPSRTTRPANRPATTVFDVKVSPVPDLTMPYSDSFPVIAKQCDEDGNPYVSVLGSGGLEILGLTEKGLVPFATNKMYDIPEPRAGNLFVDASGVYVLVQGMENAHKQEVPYRDGDGKEIRQWETKGDPRSYIARFSNDGAYKGAVRLGSELKPLQLGVFASGNLAIAGVDDGNIPRVAIFDSAGTLLKYLDLAKDITNKPDSGTIQFSKSIGGSATAEVVAMFAQFYAFRGNLLFVRSMSDTPVYEIHDGGEVRVVRIKMPKGTTIDHLIPSQDKWYFVVTALVHPHDSGSVKPAETNVIEVDPETGEYLGRYQISETGLTGESNFNVSCEAHGRFSGIAQHDGKLVVLRGTGEPAAAGRGPSSQ